MAIYYVATNGTPGGAGTIGDPKSISWAFSNAIAGDTVHIKSGVYIDYNLVVGNDGTFGNTIKFIGYNNNIGDITTVDGQGASFNYGDTADGSTLPLIRENRINNIGQGQGIINDRDYIELENLQIQYYKDGMRASGNHCIYKNLVSIDAGDFTPGVPSNSVAYWGWGFVLKGPSTVNRITHMKVINCRVINAATEGFHFENLQGNVSIDSNGIASGDNIFCNGNSVYGDNNNNTIAYHYFTSNAVTDTWHKNVYVERVATVGNEPAHHGHGIVTKCNTDLTSGNLTEDFEVVNTYLEYQFPFTQNNIARNGKLRKAIGIDGTEHSGGINLKNGADNQTFENIFLDRCEIRFLNQPDGLSGWEADSSDGNTFKNLIIDLRGTTNFRHIKFSHFNRNNEVYESNNNKFYNCTFIGGEALFQSNHSAPGTELINCNIDNITNLIKNHNNTSTYPGFTLLTTYDHCNFTGGFTAPSGTSITTHDSDFENNGADSLEFQLASNSNLINIGKIGTGNLLDFGDNVRDASPDIGAWEFDAGHPPVTPDSKKRILAREALFINN